MMNDGLSPADIMAMTNGNDANAIWSNPFMYLIWIWAFRMFNNPDNATTQGALTRAELTDGLGRQDIMRNQDTIMSELSSFERDAANNWGNVKYDNLQNLYSLQSAMGTGFGNVERALTDNRFAQQTCCCETNRNLDSVRSEAYKNTCEITNAIRSEGELTRALINQNTMQELRDRLEDRDRQLLYVNIQNSQYAQTGTLIEAIRPVSKPAYITCSPYAANTGCNSGGCGY